MSKQQDNFYLVIKEEVEKFRKRVYERMENCHQKHKACRIHDAIITRLAQEARANMEMRLQLTKLCERCDGLDRICESFKSGVTISDSDQNRLDIAKEMYEIGKRLTAIRFDYSAPPNVAKGYIKCEKRRVLRPFEIESGNSDELWAMVEDVVDTKENQAPNQ